jgi:signal transduction histidine kinase
MGLAICKQIAENHKGYLFAKVETDMGAQFILILPSL